MGKSKVSKFIKPLALSAEKRLPAILMGFGIAGMATTIGMVIVSTPKALDLMNEKKEELEKEELTKKETVEAVWKCYIPAALMFSLSTACLVGSHSVSTRRYAALMTAYALTESDLNEYQLKVKELFGEKKEEEVRTAVAKDKLDKNPIDTKEVVITDKGETLCFEPLSSRYFKTDIDKLKGEINNLNRQMLEENYISLNDYYYAIGLSPVLQGDDLGWNVYKGYIDLNISAHITENGLPCIYLGHYTPPVYDYKAY